MSASDPVLRFFDAIARRYDRVYAPSAADTRAHMAKILAHLAPRSRVLDLGVGTGRELPAILDAGHDVVGLDFSEAMLAECRKRTRPIRTVRADFWEGLPFDAHSFDAVIALHGTLAHPPSELALDALLADVANVLRGGGAFVAEVPGVEWLTRAADTWESEDGDRSMRVDRDARRIHHVDVTSGRAITGTVDDADRWRARFGGAEWATATVEPSFDVEMLVVARRSSTT